MPQAMTLRDITEVFTKLADDADDIDVWMSFDVESAAR